MFRKIQHVHFVGIGGAGMSGIEIATRRGLRDARGEHVAGLDLRAQPIAAVAEATGTDRDHLALTCADLGQVVDDLLVAGAQRRDHDDRQVLVNLEFHKPETGNKLSSRARSAAVA